jgi:uncharacterized lipoprotein
MFQTLPNLIKGTAVIGACSYQTQQARTFHDPDNPASTASTGLVTTSATNDSKTHAHDDAYEVHTTQTDTLSWKAGGKAPPRPRAWVEES